MSNIIPFASGKIIGNRKYREQNEQLEEMLKNNPNRRIYQSLRKGVE